MSKITRQVPGAQESVSGWLTSPISLIKCESRSLRRHPGARMYAGREPISRQRCQQQTTAPTLERSFGIQMSYLHTVFLIPRIKVGRHMTAGRYLGPPFGKTLFRTTVTPGGWVYCIWWVSLFPSLLLSLYVFRQGYIRFSLFSSVWFGVCSECKMNAPGLLFFFVATNGAERSDVNSERRPHI